MNYPGSKNHVYQKIINLIPPHRIYIEAFAGGGAVLRNKRPAAGNIAIDADTSALEQLRSTIAENGELAQATQFIRADAIAWLSAYQFQGDEFVYADPPYLMATRRQHRQIYRCELGEEGQHLALLNCLKSLPCAVMISGYWSEPQANAQPRPAAAQSQVIKPTDLYAPAPVAPLTQAKAPAAPATPTIAAPIQSDPRTSFYKLGSDAVTSGKIDFGVFNNLVAKAGRSSFADALTELCSILQSNGHLVAA